MNVSIKDKLYTQIKSYCSLNGLQIGEYINDLLQKAFMVDKYGDRPPFIGKKQNKKNEKEETKPIKKVEWSPELENDEAAFHQTKEEKEASVVEMMQEKYNEDFIEKIIKPNSKVLIENIKEMPIETLQQEEQHAETSIETEVKPKKHKLKK